MLKAIKKFTRERLNNAGIEVRKNPYLDPVKLQRKLLEKDNPVIFDIGAYIGTTCQSYRIAFPKATIHAFEPFPESFAALEKVTNPDPLMFAHNCAIGASTGVSTLKVNKAKATNSILGIADEASSSWGPGRLEGETDVQINVDTVDHFCELHKIQNIDLVKMDVQGLEYSVLQGSINMLKQQRIKLIYQEIILAKTYDGQHPISDYLTLMNENNYQLIDFFEPIRGEGRLLQMDMLFAKEGV